MQNVSNTESAGQHGSKTLSSQVALAETLILESNRVELLHENDLQIRRSS